MTGTHGVEMTDADIKAIKRRVYRGRVNKPSDNTLQLLCERVTELEKIVERLQRASVSKYY